MFSWLLVILFAIVVIYIMSRIFALPSGAISSRDDPHGPFPREPLESVGLTPDTPMPFGYKLTWLAIRSSNSKTVLEALPIDDIQQANWRTGYLAAYRGHTFVSPSVDGWVFVVGYNLPGLDVPEKSTNWTKLMTHMAQQFEEVQFFGTHRVVEYHAWARFVVGKEQRAYAYAGESGETLADRGEKTAGEIELGHNFFDERSPEAESDEYWEREDLSYPNEEDVMLVAGKWSINPQLLDQINAPEGVGWIGALGEIRHDSCSLRGSKHANSGGV